MEASTWCIDINIFLGGDKMTTMPDFEVMAQNLVIRHCCSMQPIEVGISEELKAMFDQGYVLGRREEAETDEWFSAQDSDKLWEAEFGVLEQQLEAFKKKNATDTEAVLAGAKVAGRYKKAIKKLADR